MPRALTSSRCRCLRCDVRVGGCRDQFVRARRGPDARTRASGAAGATPGQRRGPDAGAQPPGRRGQGTVQVARDSRRHAHRRERRSSSGSRRRGRFRQPYRLGAERRHAGPRAANEPRAAERRPRGRRHRACISMPGFVDMHVHAGGAPKNADAEYAYKLWLGHGVTTVRGVPLGSNSVTVGDKLRSEKNEIVAPRIYQLSAARQRLGQGPGRDSGAGARVRPLGGGQRHRRPEARRRAPRHHGGASR